MNLRMTLRCLHFTVPSVSVFVGMCKENTIPARTYYLPSEFVTLYYGRRKYSWIYSVFECQMCHVFETLYWSKTFFALFLQNSLHRSHIKLKMIHFILSKRFSVSYLPINARR